MKKRRGTSGRRFNRSHFVTKSGKTIKVNRNLVARWVGWRDDLERRKAERRAGLPKGHVKRFMYHFKPRRMADYWFSREGGIMALKIFGISVAAGFVLLLGMFAYFRKDLPNLKDISGSNIGGSMQYYDRSGKVLLWEDYDAVKRIPVQQNDISQYIKAATVAVEDKDFFKHGGFDVRGIIRAGWNNFFGGKGTTQGGSTITQQLIKLTQNWTGDRSYIRKIKEVILSVDLERSYSKQEILTGYLNTAPYGGIEYGVEAAARDYFNKGAKDLTIEESAMLASIPKSPRYYSPYSADFNKESFTGRKNYVLDQMAEQHMITAAQRDAAKKADVLSEVKPRPTKYAGIKAPYFVLTAKEQLENKFGAETVKRGGWKVITTLDLNMQGIAESQVSKGLAQVKRQGGDEIAFAAEDVKTGQMVALVGGVDFTNPTYGQNNYARYRLPPGSSFKAYDYTSLLENTTNFGAGSVLYDTVGPLPGYPCTNKATPTRGGNCLNNFDLRSPGPETIRYALGGSRNIPAVKAMLIAGIDKTIDVANKLGLSSGYKCYKDDALSQEGPCYASSAIGDGAYLKLDEHVHGYASISRNGLNLPQTYILKIQDASGKTVDEWKPTKGDQAVRSESAYIVADILSDPNPSYFPAGNKPQVYKGWRFGVKTGTTNDAKDGWMLNFSTQYAAGVWVGYHNRQRAMSGSMEIMTQPIVRGWMTAVHENLKPESRVKPSGIKTLPAYVVRSHVGYGSIEPGPSTDLFPSWYQQKSAAPAKPQIIDMVSNKTATDCTPDRAKKEINNASANAFSGDTFVQNGTPTSEQDDVHKCEDAHPGISLSATQAGANQYTISVSVTEGSHPIDSEQYRGTVNYIVDGQTVASFNIGGPGNNLSPFTYTLPDNQPKEISAQIIDSVLYDASSSGVTLNPTNTQQNSGPNNDQGDDN